MSLKLYALPGSHPCAAVEAALQLKGVDYRRADMVPLQHLIAGPLLYGGLTVPGIRRDGERIVGSRKIMRRLDELAPQPPLLPEDPAKRSEVLEVERWGDEVLQTIPRQIIYAAFVRNPSVMADYAAEARLRLLDLPSWALRPMMATTARLMAGRNGARDRVVQAELVALPGRLEKIDAWITNGLLGGETPNAADLQIGSSIRLLSTLEDLQPLLAGHPATTLTRYFPPQSGRVPAGTLPADWLPPTGVLG